MTKILKWWQRVSFYNKLKATLVSIGIGSEVALHVGDASPLWRWFTVAATVVSIIITNFIQDENNNGQADIFENQ